MLVVKEELIKLKDYYSNQAKELSGKVYHTDKEVLRDWRTERLWTRECYKEFIKELERLIIIMDREDD